jgi:hypothetical protein
MARTKRADVALSEAARDVPRPRARQSATIEA